MSGSETWNFCYPTDLSKLRTEKLKLVPFDVRCSPRSAGPRLPPSQGVMLSSNRLNDSGCRVSFFDLPFACALPCETTFETPLIYMPLSLIL